MVFWFYITDLVYHLRDMAESCFLWDIEMLAGALLIPVNEVFLRISEGIWADMWVGNSQIRDMGVGLAAHKGAGSTNSGRDITNYKFPNGD